jgi:hypothetical protein
MKSFKEFIHEDNSEHFDGKKLSSLGKRTANAVSKHPAYQHIYRLNRNIDYRIEKNEFGHKTVHADTVDALGNEHTVEFHLNTTGGKVDAHKHFIHKPGDFTRDGSKIFKIKSQSGYES